jgi:serine/threonine-protein kinase
MRWSSLTFAFALLTPALSAHAQSSDKATAEALFTEGRRLMSDGKVEQACQKFEASQKLDPGVGTLLNLAECYERSGRTASAWAQFREAISLARAAGSAEREELARERADALEKRLARLTVSVKGEAPLGLEVRRDGTRLDPAELGIAIPVDPGSHAVAASAPGRAEFSTKVEVGGDGARPTGEIPELSVAGGEPAPATATAEVTTPSTPSGGSTQKTIGVIAAGLGAAGLGIGTFFGLKASSTWDDAKGKCTDYPQGCGSEGTSLGEDARTQANVSTIGFGAGLAFLTVGAVLWFTASPSNPEATSVGIGPAGATVKGSF